MIVPTTLRARRTTAFTLVELIVVLGIILLIASLAIGGIIKMLDYQQRRNSETEISKLDQALQKMYIRTIDTAKNEGVSANELALANGDPRRAQVIHIKARLMQMFPTNFAEAKLGGPFVGTNPAYVRALKNVNGRNWDHESAACLYMILKQSVRGGDFDPDTSLAAQEARDPVGDGPKEILDGWGNPIVFCRWPGVAPSQSAGLVPLMPKFSGNPPTTKGNDPADPENLLTDATWIGATFSGNQTCGAYFSANFHPVFATGNYDLRPVILSQGTDGQPFTRDDFFNLQLTP